MRSDWVLLQLFSATCAQGQIPLRYHANSHTEVPKIFDERTLDEGFFCSSSGDALRAGAAIVEEAGTDLTLLKPYANADP